MELKKRFLISFFNKVTPWNLQENGENTLFCGETMLFLTIYLLFLTCQKMSVFYGSFSYSLFL